MQRERQAFVYRRDFPVRGDKAVRAQSIRGRDGRGTLHSAGCILGRRPALGLLTFPAGRHVDQVDALGLIGQLLDTITFRKQAARP
jgi:hypothetical protein